MKKQTEDTLETPVMEKDVMKEPWITQNTKTSAHEEENTVFSVWEENYQDLSDWCMDAFQGPCVFLTGESEATGHLGTKIEDKSVSTTTLGIVEEDKGVIYASTPVVEKIVPKMEEGGNTTNIKMIHKYKPKEEKVEEPVDLPDVWLDPPKSSIALRTDEWIKLVDSDRIDEPLQRDSWDVINTFDSAGSNSFDLLSYLCDDDIQSPDGSVSMDSASVFTTNSNEQSIFRKQARDKKPETITSSTLSNATHQDDTKPSSSRSTRGLTRASTRVKVQPKIQQAYTRNRGKKRTIESDSDDRMSDCSYRESREKNNEASRKSRLNKKAKENEMMARAAQLEKDNRLLKMKVEELEKMVTSLRAAILRSALKKDG